MSVLILTVLVFLLCGCYRYTVDSKPYYGLEKARDHFNDFVVKFNKVYADEDEKEKRFEIFKNVLIEINKLNSESEHAVFEEFHKFNTGYRKKRNLTENNNICVQLSDKDVKTNTAPETNFNWRDQNVVTDVKNQSTCGACWAFAATGVVEAQYALSHKQLLSLSAQQLMDCVSGSSCYGGLPEEALSYLIKVNGQMSDADYPYTVRVNSCKFNSSKIIAKPTECFEYTLKDEDKLREVLYTKGPLAIGIDFNMKIYYGYHGGVLDRTKCGTNVNHAVLLVGYGITDDGKKYWIIKNSFGPNWGESSYFRLEMGTNTCGMMTTPSLAATVA